MKTIIITGSVGSGKTTLAKRLANETGYCYIDVNDVIRRHKIAEGYDRKRKARIIDTNRLNKALIEEISILKKNKKIKSVIIDSHLSHNFPAKYTDLCIVTKCDLKVLSGRLRERGYSEMKIRENLDAEIFDVCYEESKVRGHNTLIVDTTKGINSKVLSSLIKEIK